VLIGGRRTGIRLKAAFWSAFEEIMERESLTLNTLITRIHGAQRSEKNLSGAVRIFILGYFYSLAHQRLPSIPLEHESRTYNYDDRWLPRPIAIGFALPIDRPDRLSSICGHRDGNLESDIVQGEQRL
jgi:predicted DNA-binding ribbon-helix-helix protein